MRAKEIFEGKFDPKPLGRDMEFDQLAEKTAEYIKKNCQPWLTQTNNGKLVVYRGVAAYGYAFVKAIRKNRIPLDSSPGLSKAMNSLIQHAIGPNAAMRNNSAFVSGSREVADYYTHNGSHIFIPVGDFRFTWSPKIKDWYNALSTDGATPKNEADNLLPYIFYPQVIHYYKTLMQQAEDSWIFDAMANDGLFDNSIPPRYINHSKIKKLIRADNLKAAIKSNNEIMISAAAGVYIEPEFYNKVLPLLATTKPKQLKEGPNDPHTNKAVFLLGGPGSGKTTVAKKLFSHTGLKTVNVDEIYDILMKKVNPVGGYNDELYKMAHAKTMKRLRTLMQGNIGLIIDGTGRKIDRIEKINLMLKEYGYDTIGLFVNTSLETALERNELRIRKVDPAFLQKTHKEVKRNLGDLHRIFGSAFLILDNEESPDTSYIEKQLRKFLSK